MEMQGRGASWRPRESSFATRTHPPQTGKAAVVSQRGSTPSQLHVHHVYPPQYQTPISPLAAEIHTRLLQPHQPRLHIASAGCCAPPGVPSDMSGKRQRSEVLLPKHPTVRALSAARCGSLKHSRNSLAPLQIRLYFSVLLFSFVQALLYIWRGMQGRGTSAFHTACRSPTKLQSSTHTTQSNGSRDTSLSPSLPYHATAPCERVPRALRPGGSSEDSTWIGQGDEQKAESTLG